jgi:thiol-disulfide isomerase/thioredoxin
MGLAVVSSADAGGPSFVELSARWSLPTPATRVVPWVGADARVLHAADVAGRELASLAVPGKHTIVEFGAEWCEPCQIVRPQLEALARRPNVAVRFVDVDECPDFAARHGAYALPTFFLLDPHGAVLQRTTGSPPEPSSL